MADGMIIPPHDWTDTSRYKIYSKMDIAGLAFEFLLRNAEYAVIAKTHLTGCETARGSDQLAIDAKGIVEAQDWGLDHLQWPAPAMDHRHVFWGKESAPFVLVVDAIPHCPSGREGFDIGAYGHDAKVLRCPDGTERLSIVRGSSRFLFHIRRGTVLRGAVDFKLIFEPGADLKAQRAELDRFIALRFGQAFPPGHGPSQTEAERYARILQALDGERAGATQREIAEVMFGRERVAEVWGQDSNWARARIGRLLREGRALINLGYLKLLREF